MPLNTAINVDDTVNPWRAIFTVENQQPGVGPTVYVDVMISWDPAHADCIRIVSPAGGTLHSSCCTWSNRPIPSNQTRFFVIEVNRVMAGATNVAGVATDPVAPETSDSYTAMP